MKQGIRFITVSLVLVHLSLFGMAAFCQTELQSSSQTHDHTTDDNATNSDYCRWSCQVSTTTPTLAQSTPLINLPIWDQHDSLTFSFQANTHLALRFLSPRAPPA